MRSLKARILHETAADSGKDGVDEAIAFFADNHRANNKNGVNFFYLYSAIAGSGEPIKAQNMAFAWLDENVFSDDNSPVNATETDFGAAMTMIKNYEVVERFLASNPIGKIAAELDYADINTCDQLLRLFYVKRVIFLTQVADRLTIAKTEEPEKIAEFFKSSCKLPRTSATRIRVTN
ncbi:MAG: hypothetical protein JST42_28780 [Bacteroidetes bacterium]|nr:hypothetical protein [Bacteroidota bacterium]